MMMMMIAAAGKTPRLPNICLLAATNKLQAATEVINMGHFNKLLS